MSKAPILVAVGLGGRSDRVVELGVAAARGLGRAVVLLHALDRPEEAFPVPEAFAALAGRQRSEEATHDEEKSGVLAALRQKLEGAGIDVQTRLSDGRPWQAICDAASEIQAAMVVLGNNTGSATEADAQGWKERVLGSTVDRVVRTACCPVLIAAGEGALPASLQASRWLVGTDFSPSSIVAIEAAVGFVEDLGGSLEVAHVVEKGAAADSEAHRQFAEFVELNAPGASAHLVEGPANPAVALCTAAEDRDADVLVVGTHGMSAHARLVVGSTGERCLRRARHPLMLVPTP